MSKSIMQDEKECFVSGYPFELDKHHVYHGPRRSAAERSGCWCWLRHDIHMDLHNGNTKLDKALKAECQVRFEKKHGHKKFIEVFGKNYMED